MKIKFPFGSTAENNQLTLPEGLITIDLERKAIRLHDGITQGGFEMLGVQAYTPVPGVDWTNEVVNAGVTFNAGVVNPSDVAGVKYVLVGNGGYLFTAPAAGTPWTSRVSGFGSTNIFDVAFNGTMYVAVGNSGIITTSTSGTSWTGRTSGTSNRIASVIWANGYWWALINTGADTTMLRSTDGITWTTVTHGLTFTKEKIRYINGKFFIIGQDGGLAVSDDGATGWTTLTSGFAATIRGIAYGNGKYVYVGNSGKVATSPDGITWTDIVTSITATCADLLFVQGHFITVTLDGKTYTSPDAITWTEQNDGITTQLNYLRSNGDELIAGGTVGTLLKSALV